jgi:hypothetical protein
MFSDSMAGFYLTLIELMLRPSYFYWPSIPKIYTIMKFLSGLCLSLLLSVPVFAQNAREGNVRYKHEDRNGVMADYDAPKDNTEDALAKRLEAANIGKKSNESGYWKYEGVNWPEIAPEKIDVYFNVERHKGSAVVYMMVSTGYGNFVTTALNPQVIENMKSFLTKFAIDLAAYQHDLALTAQADAVKDADRKLHRADRETDRANRRQKTADREKDKKQNAVDEEKKKLEELQKTQP